MTRSAVHDRPTATRTFRAMATDITVRIEDARTDDPSFDLVTTLFDLVQRECTRFDPTSPLMQANAAATEWYVVPEFCFAAIHEAYLAYEATDGLFDPRVLRALTELGYDRTLPFASPVSIDTAPATSRAWGVRERPAEAAWEPEFDPERQAVRIGPDPIDLGGIGKGLAVRWAAEAIAQRHPTFLVEAGGDCYLAGDGPENGRWNVGLEDPLGSAEPLAVLSLTDLACTTSSTRFRSWRVAGRPVHHLIDPRTGEPSTTGLRSVTVVQADPARAEVWSKALFVAGRDAIGGEVSRHGLAAAWIDEAGRLESSEAMQPYIAWTRGS